MAAVIEVRTYRATPGSRETLIEAMRTQATPVHREIGMKVLGPFPSTEDEDTFVWLRAFPDAESRDPMKESFYGGPLCLGELEPALRLPSHRGGRGHRWQVEADHHLLVGRLTPSLRRAAAPHPRDLTEGVDRTAQRADRREIVDREVTGPVPAPVYYSLTEYGRSVLPIVDATRAWGRGHIERFNG